MQYRAVPQPVVAHHQMKSILFIEDDPVLGPLYEFHLKNAGYDVTRAVDGEAGLTALQSRKPDLIVLDIVLPKISGVELLQMIRTSPGVEEIPVIVFTNTFKQDLMKEVERIGATRILTKSRYVPRDVIGIIGEVLKGTSTEPAEEGAIDEDEQHVRSQVQTLLGQCRVQAAAITHETGNDFRLPKMRALRTAVRQLTGCASALDLKTQAYFCEAFDALLAELTEQPERITVSSLRTIAQAVDFLFEFLASPKDEQQSDAHAFAVLIVDDDAISRRALQAALQRIQQKGTECATAADALDQAGKTDFDLIFLDVDMPEQTGDALCADIRKCGKNSTTPVIFVTGHTDLQTRAKSTLSGGTDFIGKPFHFMELALKSLLHVLRRKAKQP